MQAAAVVALALASCLAFFPGGQAQDPDLEPGCSAQRSSPVSFKVWPAEDDGVLSLHWRALHRALSREASRLTRLTRLTRPTAAAAAVTYHIIGVDSGCEQNWPRYAHYEDDANFVRGKGDARTCRSTRHERLLRFLKNHRLPPYLDADGGGFGSRDVVVIFDMFGVMSDQPPEITRHPDVVLAGPSFSPATYRQGKDLAFPPMPIIVGSGDALEDGSDDPSCGPWRHTAVFKGTDTAEVRRRLQGLDTGADGRIVVKLKPFKDDVEAVAFVDEYSDDADAANTAAPAAPAAAAAVVVPEVASEYVQLLTNTKFAFVPRGDNPYSFRLFEAICAGAVPIVLADDWVLPFSEPGGANYSSFLIRVPEAEWASLPGVLAQYDDASVCRMQAAALKACDHHFGALESQARTLFEILSRRHDGHDAAACSKTDKEEADEKEEGGMSIKN